MTKEQFVAEIKAEKAQYMMAIEAYFDALIEHDFDKACRLASNAICVLKPDVQAYMAEQMYELDSYEELEETYKNVVDDVLNELDKDTGE